MLVSRQVNFVLCIFCNYYQGFWLTFRCWNNCVLVTKLVLQMPIVHLRIERLWRVLCGLVSLCLVPQVSLQILQLDVLFGGGCVISLPTIVGSASFRFKSLKQFGAKRKDWNSVRRWKFLRIRHGEYIIYVFPMWCFELNKSQTTEPKPYYHWSLLSTYVQYIMLNSNTIGSNLISEDKFCSYKLSHYSHTSRRKMRML